MRYLSDAQIVDARWTLQRHIRMVDGRCRGCYVDLNHSVRHPCGYVEYAAQIEGSAMTFAFLNSSLGSPLEEKGQPVTLQRATLPGGGVAGCPAS